MKEKRNLGASSPGTLKVPGVGLTVGSGDLAAAARVLQARGDLAEVVKLFEVNCALHWDSARCHERLAAALLESGDRENAHKAAERALRYNKDPERLQELTALIQETASNSGWKTNL